MKKQFFRVKQLADQRFLRAEKTEALSDDLQDAERKVDFIRAACLSAGKKLGNATSSSGHDPTTVKEKRLKKNLEYLLGTSMLECASVEDDHLLRQVVTDCGKLQICLANAIVDHEMRVENNVADPLLNVVDNDYPNIIKLKKTLSKLILDMDSAKTRYQQALKHNVLNNSSKVDSIKDELEEAEGKVEQCRDALACEMLQLISREAELSSVILDYARLQRNHHVTAIAILDEIIPEMETHINESAMKPIFGKPLEEHLRVTGRKIAYPIELCVCGLLELGIAEEGLFRVAPGASKLRRMKLCLDANYLQFETALQYRDPHVFAGVLKSYLRELPEPLLTHKLYDQWMAAARVMSGGNQDEGLNALWTVLHNLPQANFDNLQYLVKFLSSLASNKHSNKMTPQNIAIVIAPNLIWSPNDDSNTIGMNMNVANLHSIIVDSLVTFADWFFQGEMDFYVTLSRDSVGFLNGHGSDQTDPPAQDIKRTQSNDSLSDHNSPPQGSPKPAIRSRKQKPAAPHPPGYHRDREDKSSGDDKSKDKSKSSGDDKSKDKSKSSGDDKSKDKSKSGGDDKLKDKDKSKPSGDDKSKDKDKSKSSGDDKLKDKSKSSSDDKSKDKSKSSGDDKSWEKCKPSPVKDKDEVLKNKPIEDAKDKKLEQKPPPPPSETKKVERYVDLKDLKKEEMETQMSASVKPQVPPPAIPTTPPAAAVAPTSVVSPVAAVSPAEAASPAPTPSPSASNVAAEEHKDLPHVDTTTTPAPAGDTKRPDIGFEGFKPLETHFPAVFTPNEKKFGDLDKRTSKSGEDLRKLKSNEMTMYATLDRKKPPRPTPAPRISLEGTPSAVESKPAIPERPAALQRPLSSSFRIVRPPLDSSPSESEVRTLERAHVFSLDKQQVSYIQVSSNDKVPIDKKSVERERRESGEKPEKPKKPDSLLGHSGHHRAASEGSIIDTGFSSTDKRPPRPTPPPPPVASPTKTRESTDL